MIRLKLDKQIGSYLRFM